MRVAAGREMDEVMQTWWNGIDRTDTAIIRSRREGPLPPRNPTAEGERPRPGHARGYRGRCRGGWTYRPVFGILEA